MVNIVIIWRFSVYIFRQINSFLYLCDEFHYLRYGKRGLNKLKVVPADKKRTDRRSFRWFFIFNNIETP